MYQHMEFALWLIKQKDETGLIRWLISTTGEHRQTCGILCGLLDISGRYLHCTAMISRQPEEFILEANDFTHPLAGVLQSGQPALWDSLHSGARTENLRFHQILEIAGSQCGLYVLPLKDERQRLTGVLALFDRAEVLHHWQSDPALPLLASLFIIQLTLLRQLVSSQSEKNMLRHSLRHITDTIEQQRYKTRLLENCLTGQSAAIALLRQKILQTTSAQRLSVLIEGENGSGKNLVAELLHQCSVDDSAPFVVVNCAGVSAEQLETELFGYQKGVFSAGDAGKNGALAQAQDGTLFLDEIDNMSLATQVRLLWILETSHYRNQRSGQTFSANFRLITSSCRCLSQQVSGGAFHENLYQRIAQCLILIPPLRDRQEDIIPLSQRFIREFAGRQHLTPPLLSPDFTDSLLRYPFPGNVRELKNLLELACSHTSSGEKITDRTLPGSVCQRLYAENSQNEEQYQQIHDLRLAIQCYERQIIFSRLHLCQGNRDAVAKSLNIPRRTLDHKCRKLETET